MSQNFGPGAQSPHSGVDPQYTPTQEQPATAQTGYGNQGNDFGAQAARFAREHISTPETKEFYKTSEFLLLVLGIVGLLVASAVTDAFDAGRVWTLLTILGVGYLLSRGFSKAGTRRDLDHGASSAVGTTGGATATAGFDPVYGHQLPQGEGGAGAGHQVTQFVDQHIRTPETKEFFKTSEFMLWVLGVAGILIAAAAAADIFEATRAWTLVTVLSIGYMVSRGLSKAGTHRRDDWDSDEHTSAYGQPADGGAMAQFTRHVSTPETKEFFKTSEFLVWALTAAAILIASAVVDIFDAPEAWNLITWLTAGYILSRGLAKIGTRREIDRGAYRSQASYGVGSGFTTGPQGGTTSGYGTGPAQQ